MGGGCSKGVTLPDPMESAGVMDFQASGQRFDFNKLRGDAVADLCPTIANHHVLTFSASVIRKLNGRWCTNAKACAAPMGDRRFASRFEEPRTRLRAAARYQVVVDLIAAEPKEPRLHILIVG